LAKTVEVIVNVFLSGTRLTRYPAAGMHTVGGSRWLSELLGRILYFKNLVVLPLYSAVPWLALARPAVFLMEWGGERYFCRLAR
jgi:hypothetical protein